MGIFRRKDSSVYSVGQLFSLKGHRCLYLLAHITSEKVSLISLDGEANRFRDGTPVNNINNITNFELERILGKHFYERRFNVVGVMPHIPVEKSDERS